MGWKGGYQVRVGSMDERDGGRKDDEDGRKLHFLVRRWVGFWWGVREGGKAEGREGGIGTYIAIVDRDCRLPQHSWHVANMTIAYHIQVCPPRLTYAGSRSPIVG